MGDVLRGVEWRPLAKRALRGRGFVVGGAGLAQMALQGKAGTDHTAESATGFKAFPSYVSSLEKGREQETPGLILPSSGVPSMSRVISVRSRQSDRNEGMSAPSIRA